MTVVDIDRVFARAAANGSPGFDLFVDNCHPNDIGNARIVAEILRALAEEKLILAADTPIPSPESVLEYFHRGLGAAGPRRGLRLEWFLRSGRYAMKEPWYDFALARRYLESGAALAPRDWRPWANLGTLALLDADRDRGVALLRKATVLRGAPLDPADPTQLPYLGDAMERHGLDLVAFD